MMRTSTVQKTKYLRSATTTITGRRLAGYLLAATAVGILATSSPVTSVIAQATSHHAEAFTELYFTHPDQLPTSIKLGQLQSVPYRITNHEAVTKSYRYQVLLTSGNVTTTISEGTLTLNDGASADEMVKFTILKNQSNLVRIVLVGRTEQIAFRSQS
jgi:uncharacterized membrane protein